MADTFEQLIGADMAETLRARGIATPTPVQIAAIPLLSGMANDIIVSAETGSGKTLAYLLPIVMRIDPAVRAAQAVVLAPTHELAAQVHREAVKLLADAKSPCTAALIIGGTSHPRQLDALKTKPAILIGSVGRLNELAEARKLKLHEVKLVVLDEADRLLDGDNAEAVFAFIKRTLADRRLALFSASILPKTEEAVKHLLRSLVTLRLQAKAEVPPSVKHILLSALQREKAATLRKLFHAEKIKKGIVFVNNPYHVVTAAERLRAHGIPCAALHGEAHPNERRQALDALREGRIALLVASDMAARGLDIPSLSHIVNLDLPEQPEAYLHRAGRTGRMGASGTVVTIATAREKEILAQYARRFGFSVAERFLAVGALTTAANQPVQKERPNTNPQKRVKGEHTHERRKKA